MEAWLLQEMVPQSGCPRLVRAEVGPVWRWYGLLPKPILGIYCAPSSVGLAITNRRWVARAIGVQVIRVKRSSGM
jgi:hypothetical protein